MTIVFTNGCFDILHRGHIDYLRLSRKLGDRLVVGVNSDASVKPINLIKKIRPDIITKGGDYKEEDVVGYGLAKVIIIPFKNGYSTTKVINESSGHW